MDVDPTRPEQAPATYAELHNFVTAAAANFGVTEPDANGRLSWDGAQAGRSITVEPRHQDGREQLGVTVAGPRLLLADAFRPAFDGRLDERPDELHFRVDPNPQQADPQVWVMAITRGVRVVAPAHCTYGELLEVFQSVGTEIAQPRRLWRTLLGFLALSETTLAERARNGMPFSHW